MSTNNGGPVFPLDVTDQGGDTEVHLGLMLRDYFAAQALAAMIGTAAAPCLLGLSGAEGPTAAAAYAMADAMLAERAKEPRADATPALLAALHEYHDEDYIGRDTDSPRYRMAREAIEAAERVRP